MIPKKTISAYYSDDDKAIIAKKNDLKTASKRKHAELAEIDALIAKRANGDIDSQSEDQHLQDIINGIEVERPLSYSAKRTAKQYEIRDNERAQDYMADKVRLVDINAGKRLTDDIKLQAVAAEKELVDALVIAHEKHRIVWDAKRHLLSNGIGLFGLFDSNIDDVLGVPVDRGTPLAEYFREEVKRKHLRVVPKEYAL